MTQTWQDRFLKNPDHLHDIPQGVLPNAVSKVDVQRNISQLLGDTIETMDTMIAYSSKLRPKVEAMLQAGIAWDELPVLDECLGRMDALREELPKVRPLHRLIAGINTPNVAHRAAIMHADEIHTNATELCGTLLTLHHAVEAVKQHVLLDTARLSGKQKDTTEKFVRRLEKMTIYPHTEAQTLAAAVLLAAHDMKALDKRAQENNR